MKVFILGRTEHLYNSAVLLSENKHKITGIVTAGAMPEYSVNEIDFKNLARKLNIPFHFTNKIDDKTIELINNSNSDICISVNWVTILKNDVINLFPHGILNAHFGDLPSYRGNAVINWALLNNEQQIAVTIHKMVSGEIDSGEILAKEYFHLHESTTIGDIVHFCKQTTPGLFLETINKIEKGTIGPIRQDKPNIKSFRTYPRVPEYSCIDWTKSAREIHNLIRASSKPYSGAYSYIKINNEIRKIFFWRSSVDTEISQDFAVPGHVIYNDNISGVTKVYTGKGILNIEEAQFENGVSFQPGKYFKSIRIHFGLNLEDEIYNLYKIIKKND